MTYEELYEACKLSHLPLRVAYVPGHAEGNLEHPDVDWGYISSMTKEGSLGEMVFVKFDKYLKHLGWSGTQAQSCSPESLVIGSPQ